MHSHIEQHRCTNFLLTCMDFRFRTAIEDWAKQNNYTDDYDLISMAGAQKSIVDEDTRTGLMKQIKISTDLHQAKKIILMAHRDCGAYGGSKAFASWEEELKKYTTDLEQAEEIIKHTFPDADVRKLVLNFDPSGEVSFIEI
jgi:carbonic anhydrase